MAEESFGHYELLGVLGEGGMGRVYRAHDTTTNRVVALKVLPPHAVQDRTFEQRFRREAELAASLNDPHIVPIHRYGEIDGQLYVDMRLIDGRDLADVIAGNGLEPGRAVRIVEQVAEALDTAHTAGLVHRDIKPSNVLLARRDFVYLIDFGIAHAAGLTRLTNTGAAIGTFAYMAPERFESPDAEPSSDVYALACVLHECLTGTQPFPGESLQQQIAAHLTKPPPRPSDSGAPTEFDAVIAKGMAKDPEARYRSALELADAAKSALSGPRNEPRTPAPMTPVAPRLPPLQPPPMQPPPMQPPHVMPPQRYAFTNFDPTAVVPGNPPDHVPVRDSATSRRFRVPAAMLLIASLAAIGCVVMVVSEGTRLEFWPLWSPSWWAWSGAPWYDPTIAVHVLFAVAFALFGWWIKAATGDRLLAACAWCLTLAFVVEVVVVLLVWDAWFNALLTNDFADTRSQWSTLVVFAMLGVFGVLFGVRLRVGWSAFIVIAGVLGCVDSVLVLAKRPYDIYNVWYWAAAISLLWVPAVFAFAIALARYRYRPSGVVS